MNVLIIGSGGREHALAQKILTGKQCEKLFIAPGNAGTAQVGINVDIAVTDFEKISNFIQKEHISLVLVGPEVPLVAGLRDFLESKEIHRNLLIVGPGAQGAKLEGSKEFAKDFMRRNNIPTAAYRPFKQAEFEEAKKYLLDQDLPIVLKADGLAAGKGVIISNSHEDALQALEKMLLQKQFGAASESVVIESFLDGIELSVFVVTDGNDYLILPEAKDYKRIGEKDTGPNTGGMGAVSPVPFAQQGFLKSVEEEVVKPTIEGLKKEGIDYKGFIFIGLMNCKGKPYVIEYNVRMGDPETQVVMPRLESDLLEMMVSAANGTLRNYQLKVSPEYATTVVMVAGGYPGAYQTGDEIHGLPENTSTLKVFHAGTQKSKCDTKVLSNGGRVLNITGLGDNLEEALQNAYKGVSQIQWKDAYFRRDIGQDILSLL